MKAKLCKHVVRGVWLWGLGTSLAVAQSTYEPYTFTTIAGKAGVAGTADGTNSAALLHSPWQATLDGAGNLYVGDQDNGTIRKLTPVGTNWVVTTLAGLPGVRGYADGTNRAARFWDPCGVVVDSAGNIYVGEYGNCTIRKLTPVETNWVVTTLAGEGGTDPNGNPLHSGSADGTGAGALFNRPVSMAMDTAGNLYVADSINNTIRKGYRSLAITASGAGLGFSEGRFDLAITGPAGQAVVVEASPDLENWVPFWTNTFMVGPLQFSDTNSASSPQRFYRAHRP